MLDLVGAGGQDVTGRFRAQGMDPDAPSEPVRFLNGRPQFLGGKRGQPGHGPHRAAAGGHDLDVVHPGLEQPPDHPANLFDPVRLPAEVPAVAAGDRDRPPAEVQPRQGSVPQSPGALKVERRVPHAAAIAQGGDARPQGPLRVFPSGHREDAVRLAYRGFERRAVPRQDKMDVGVDEARQEGVPPQVQGAGARRPPSFGSRAGVDLPDPAVLDDDGGIVDRRCPRAVHEPRCADDQTSGCRLHRTSLVTTDHRGNTASSHVNSSRHMLLWPVDVPVGARDLHAAPRAFGTTLNRPASRSRSSEPPFRSARGTSSPPVRASSRARPPGCRWDSSCPSAAAPWTASGSTRRP